MKPKNVVAQELRTPKYKPRITKNKKVYDRKIKNTDRGEGQGKGLNIDFYLDLFALQGALNDNDIMQKQISSSLR